MFCKPTAFSICALAISHNELLIMTKHTSAHLKILVGGFCQKKEEQTFCKYFSSQKILMKQGVILKVFLWHSQQQLQNLLRT